MILFDLFDEFESEQKNEEFSLFARNNLSQMDWGDQEYLEKHVLDIAIRIYPELSSSE